MVSARWVGDVWFGGPGMLESEITEQTRLAATEEFHFSSNKPSRLDYRIPAVLLELSEYLLNKGSRLMFTFVKSVAPYRDRQGRNIGAQWLVRCTNCASGRLRIVRSNQIRTVNTVSCGCHKRSDSQVRLTRLRKEPEFEANRLKFYLASDKAKAASIRAALAFDPVYRAERVRASVIHRQTSSARMTLHMQDPAFRKNLAEIHTNRYKSYRISKGCDPDTSMSTMAAQLRVCLAPLVREVVRNAAYLCQLCGMGGTLHAHHIFRWVTNPLSRTNPYNLVVLCVGCHFNRAHGGSKHRVVPELQPIFLKLAHARESATPTDFALVWSVQEQYENKLVELRAPTIVLTEN